jgi:hypothetical protein
MYDVGLAPVLTNASIGQVNEVGWVLGLATLAAMTNDYYFYVEVNQIQGAAGLACIAEPSAGAPGDDQWQFFIHDNRDVNTTVIVSYSDNYTNTYPWKK